MKGFIDQVEKGLIKFVVAGLLIMVVVQGFMTADPIRFYLSWGERMEGQSIPFPVNTAQEYSATVAEEPQSPQACLTLSIAKYSSLPRTIILINGDNKYYFSARQVTIDVKAGDTIEIDSTAYNFPIQYNITAVSSNVAYPESGQTYTADQTIIMVGKVIVK